MRAIVTVKLPRNPAHDPRNKISGKCPLQEVWCTDTTGSHHCYVESGADFEEIKKKAHEKYAHITRIEAIPPETLAEHLDAIKEINPYWFTERGVNVE